MEKSSSPRVVHFINPHPHVRRALKVLSIAHACRKVLPLLAAHLRGARVANFRRWIVYIHIFHHSPHGPLKDAGSYTDPLCILQLSYKSSITLSLEHFLIPASPKQTENAGVLMSN